MSSGRHIAYEGEPPIADLFISIASTMGVDLKTFGDEGTGKLNQLEG